MKTKTLENGNTLYYNIQETPLGGKYIDTEKLNDYAGFNYLEIVAGGGFTDLSDEWDSDYQKEIDNQIDENKDRDADITGYIEVLNIMLDDFKIIDTEDYVYMLRKCISYLSINII